MQSRHNSVEGLTQLRRLSDSEKICTFADVEVCAATC